MRSDDAIAELERRLAVRGRSTRMIAVDGHSAAGKSTFARRLAGELAAALVSGDDFYRVMEPDARAALGPEAGAARHYDWERMLDEVLIPLRAGRPARYRRYDWDRNRLGDRRTTVEPAPVVVVDGLFVSRPELSDVMDVAVVVVTEPALRARRQRDRADATDDWLRRWDAAERWYFEHVRPVSSFDVVVHGDDAAMPR